MSPEAFDKLSKDGILRSEWDLVDKEYVKAYKWLCSKMGISNPPIWAWLKRPDLRSGGHGLAGSRQVLVGLEKNSSDVWLSDFEKWHSVLNGSYLPSDEELDLLEKNEEEYDRVVGPKEKDNNLIIKSWDRVFDVAGEAQATFPELKLSDVVFSRPFVARKVSFEMSPVNIATLVTENVSINNGLVIR